MSLETAEAQLNRVIEKRAVTEAATAEEWRREAAYNEACRQAEERRQAELRRERYEYHHAQAGSILRTAQSLAYEHRSKAAKLAREAKASGVPFCGEDVHVYKEQLAAKKKEEKG